MNRTLCVMALLLCSVQLLAQPAPNPIPTVSSVTPAIAGIGGASFSITVNGTGFVTGASVARFSGTDLVSSVVSSTQLTAVVPASLVTAFLTVNITVFNPAPGGGESNFIPFYVNGGVLPFGNQDSFIPHMVNGGGFITKLTITNMVGQPNPFVVAYFTQGGTVLKTESYMLPPAGTLRIAPPESQRFADASIEWAIVNWSGPVTVNYVFEFEDQKSGLLTNAIGFNDAPPVQTFTIPVEFSPNPDPNKFPAGRTVGLAVANTETLQATLTVTMLDGNGNAMFTTFFAVPGMGQISIDLANALVNVLPPGGFIGAMVVSSNRMVSATALEDDLGEFYSVAVINGRAP